ncbi:MAG: DNA repair protein RadC [Pseudomonadota bacterium]
MADPNQDPRSGHRERQREKFRRHGLEKFTDEEIVELLLTFGTPRRDCKQAARGLLKNFGSIRGVFEADEAELAATPGVGPNNVVAIKFIYQVAGKFLEQQLVGREYLSSSRKVWAYLRHHLENLSKEVFKVIFLDSANGVVAVEDLGRGTVTGAVVQTREVIERALVLKAAGLVFVHNHPSGRIAPSTADHRLTRQLLHAAHVVDMKVVDHLIVGKGEEYYSFRDQGHLGRFEGELNDFFYSGA